MAEEFYDRTGRRFPAPAMRRSNRVDTGSRLYPGPGIMSPEELAQRTKVEALQRVGEVPFTRAIVRPNYQDEALLEAQRRSLAARSGGGGGMSGGGGGAGGEEFDWFPSEATPYTQGHDAIQREKRMNEWQRAFALGPQQAEAVQSRMIADPYDFDAATRLERANLSVAADPRAMRASQQARDDAALAMWGAGAGTQGAATRRGAAPQRSAAAPPSPFTVGEIKGKQVIVPQAGQYNAYLAAMSQVGLPTDGADPGQFADAMRMHSVDPTKLALARIEDGWRRYDSDSDAGAERYGHDRRLKGTQYTADANAGVGHERNAETNRHNLATEGRAASAATGSDYSRYLEAASKVWKGFEDGMSSEDKHALLKKAGIPAVLMRDSTGAMQVAPVSQQKWLEFQRPAAPAQAPNPFQQAVAELRRRAAAKSPQHAALLDEALRQMHLRHAAASQAGGGR